MMNARLSRMCGIKILMMFFVVTVAVFFSSCDDEDKKKGITDTLTTGTIRISADESFRPVIDAQVKVFEAQNPLAKLVVDYKPEADCLRDLTNDSVRMVIVTRAITRAEEDLIVQRYKFKPSFGIMAVDAVAVITNSKSKDTAFKLSDIQAMLRGTSELKYKVLMDGASATSTVRYVRDSLLKGEKLSKNIVAAANSQAVIEYVSKYNDAIGMIGVSWIGNPEDTVQLSSLDNIKVAGIECRGCSGEYVPAGYASIYAAKYPMVRPLYYILKENFKGLGSGFTNFLIFEKGQLIFKRAYLVPARMQFIVREMSITE